MSKRGYWRPRLIRLPEMTGWRREFLLRTFRTWPDATIAGFIREMRTTHPSVFYEEGNLPHERI